MLCGDDVSGVADVGAERLDRMQRRHRVLGFPLAVLYKFVDDQGSYLAALIPTTASCRCSRCCCY